MDMNPAFKNFLEQNGFLPLSAENKNWNVFYIRHSRKPPTKEEIKIERIRIKNEMQGKKGLYVYLNKRNILLYVGKAENLANRVFSHYKEAFRGGGVWQEFFSMNSGNLTVLWCEILTDRQRRAIKEMIEEVIQTKFDKKYPRGKRQLIKL